MYVGSRDVLGEKIGQEGAEPFQACAVLKSTEESGEKVCRVPGYEHM